MAMDTPPFIDDFHRFSNPNHVKPLFMREFPLPVSDYRRVVLFPQLSHRNLLICDVPEIVLSRNRLRPWLARKKALSNKSKRNKKKHKPTCSPTLHIHICPSPNSWRLLEPVSRPGPAVVAARWSTNTPGPPWWQPSWSRTKASAQMRWPLWRSGAWNMWRFPKIEVPLTNIYFGVPPF